jgi:hypothetical protein
MLLKAALDMPSLKIHSEASVIDLNELIIISPFN